LPEGGGAGAAGKRCGRGIGVYPLVTSPPENLGQTLAKFKPLRAGDTRLQIFSSTVIYPFQVLMS
jgi:hypothetical protein